MLILSFFVQITSKLKLRYKHVDFDGSYFAIFWYFHWNIKTFQSEELAFVLISGYLLANLKGFFNQCMEYDSAMTCRSKNGSNIQECHVFDRIWTQSYEWICAYKNAKKQKHFSKQKKTFILETRCIWYFLVKIMIVLIFIN